MSDEHVDLTEAYDTYTFEMDESTQAIVLATGEGHPVVVNDRVTPEELQEYIPEGWGRQILIKRLELILEALRPPAKITAANPTIYRWENPNNQFTLGSATGLRVPESSTYKFSDDFLSQLSVKLKEGGHISTEIVS